MDGDRLVGLISHVDILGAEGLQPFRMMSEIAGAPTPAALTEIAREVPAAMAAIVSAGLSPIRATEVRSLVTDGLTRRLLEHAQDDIGSAPCEWAWMALGSQGRREQAISTDQDHALVFEDVEQDPYFAEMASRVVGGLEACGISRCESGVMACEPGWRLPAEAWAERTRLWIMEPALDRAFLTEIVFDFRQIAGSFPGDAVLGDALDLARHQLPFVHRLALLSVKHDGRGRRFGARLVAEGGRVDVKAGGLRALTEFGRLFGIEAGSTSTSTRGRLQAAAIASVIDPEEASGLEEAFEVLMEVRLLHQLRRWKAGEAIDEQVRVVELGKIERMRLTQAFVEVRSAQRSWKARLSIT
jgi:CBS domain-containing protein